MSRSRQKPKKRKVFAGRYAYEKPLGRGAGGAVYLAEDLRAGDGRLVALKVLSAEAFATVQGKMLKREFEILSKLDHPNLVRVYDYGTLPDGGVFLAEEYIDGFSLQDARALLEPEALIDITLQMLQGLSYLHGMSTIHRDIKPANVMLLWLDDADARPMVKLVDFGLSSADPKHDTLRGGTRSYMAPEIIRGEKGELRSDLYSLGVTLYYAMCGVLPFGPRSKEDPPPTDEDFRPPDPHRLNPDVPLSLSRFTMVLLRQVPQLEFEDAGEALQALANDTEVLERMATRQLANNLDIAAPPVLRGYFERGILVRQDAHRDALVEDLLDSDTSGCLELIRGPHGVGKSRLLREVACAIKLAGRIVIPADVEPDSPPFTLVANLLRQMIDVAESRGLNIAQRLRPNLNILQRLAPWIGHAKSTDERAGDFAWLREAFEDLVVMIHPDKVVFLVEDLDRADEDSIAFLERWFDERGVAHRPSIVATAKAGGAADALAIKRAVEVSEVEGLRAEDVLYFFESRLGAEGLPESWVEKVAASSQGNPAYVEELSRHLIDAGILSRESAIQWKLERDELLDFSLPRGMGESLRRRLGALGSVGRETLELMSLIDAPVEWSVLRKLLIAGGESSDEAERNIELLLWRHFIELDLRTKGRFVRLIRPELKDVVVSRMNPDWARSLHRRIGARYKKVWLAGEADASVAAFHLDAGGRHEQAADMWEIAADAHAAAGNYRQAVVAYEASLAHMDEGQRDGLRLANLADALAKSYESTAASEMIEKAWVSAERTALEWLMYRSALSGIEISLAAGRRDEAREWYGKIRDQLPVLAQQPRILTLRARLEASLGELNDARDLAQRALARCEHFGYRDGIVDAEGLLGRLHHRAGSPELAVKHYERAIETGRGLETYSDLGYALIGCASMSRENGNHQEALEMLHEAFEIVSERGRIDLWSEALLELGEVRLALGDIEQAERRAVEALRMAHDMEHEEMRWRAQVVLGDAAIGQGRVEEGLARLKDVAATVASSKDLFPHGIIAYARYGKALTEQGQKEDGSEFLDQAAKWTKQFSLTHPG